MTSSSRTSGRRRRTSPTPSRRRSTRRCSPRTTPTCSRATSAGATCRPRAATPLSGIADSTYVRKPPYFDGMSAEPEPVGDISGARVLALLGDSVTTDHISPAGSIKPGTPAAQYLDEHGVERKDYNSFGSRRGNHEVMIRGTFANIRLRNQLLDDVSGGYTRDFTQDGAPQAFIYDAAQNYAAQDIPLVVLGGKEYGSGSSRDWAAKGTPLLGVRAVIAESFERIHRSNLIGMGVIPLQFPDGKSAKDLGLDGTEVFDITGIDALNDGKTPKTVHVKAEQGWRRPSRVRRGGAHRHPRGSRLLPQRRHPAVRAAQHAEVGLRAASRRSRPGAQGQRGPSGGSTPSDPRRRSPLLRRIRLRARPRCGGWNRRSGCRAVRSSTTSATRTRCSSRWRTRTPSGWPTSRPARASFR